MYERGSMPTKELKDSNAPLIPHDDLNPVWLAEERRETSAHRPFSVTLHDSVPAS